MALDTADESGIALKLGSLFVIGRLCVGAIFVLLALALLGSDVRAALRPIGVVGLAALVLGTLLDLIFRRKPAE